MKVDAVIVRHTARFSLPVAVLIATLGWACDSPSSPSAGSPSLPVTDSSLPPSPPTWMRYHVSGIVTDEIGSPISGAVVEVDYTRGGEFSSPPSFCPPQVPGFCWSQVVTNSGGYYEIVFEPSLGRYGVGLIYSQREGYETDIQLLTGGTPEIVQNLRLDRVRSIRAGQSITVSIEPDSALCSDLEDWWLLTSRCENVEILVPEAGTLTVDARASQSAGVIPFVFFATTGRYAGRQTPGPGTASVGVQAGERYRIYVGIPRGTAAQRYDVSTTLR
jgi:hypothetical protein